MAKSKSYEERCLELLEDFATKNHIEVVDIDFEKEAGNWYLRIYIDKESGVTIDDCELISRYIDPILDEEDFIKETYILEVSSLGLTRQLKKDKDLTRHIGDYIEVKLYKSLNGYKELVGILKSFNESVVVLEFEEDEFIELDRKNIASIKLVVMF